MINKRCCLDMRAARGTVGRSACVCTAQWNAVGSAMRSKQHPPLTYSVNRRDVTGAELGMLLAAAHSDAMVGPEAIPLCRQTYSYWRCSPEGLQHAAKLEVALRRSVFTVACFTTWDVYGDTTSSSGSGSGSGAAAWYPSDGGGGGGGGGGESQSQPPYPPSSGSRWDRTRSRDPSPARAPQQQWQPKEEECPLTAAQHGLERERELGQQHQQQQRRARGRGSPGSAPPSVSSSWPGDPASPASSLPPDGYASPSPSTASPFSMSSPSTSSPSPNPFLSSYRTSSPSSSSSAAAARTLPPSDPLETKPPTPSGVPDMDWNWLLPSGGGRSSAPSSGGRSSSSNSSGGGSSSSSRDWASGSGARSHSSPPGTTSSQQQHPWQWPARSSSPLSSPSSSSASSSSASQPPRKSLVGFARAMGDNSLVATIYDVAVHPAVRNQGIGRRLVKLLVQQVQTRSVYDIGAVTPAAAVGFWERISFDDDREGSTFMTFMGRPAGHVSLHPHSTTHDDTDDGSAAQELELEGCGGFGAPWDSQELLEVADLGCWDAVQRSEPLRALLAAKLQRAREAEAGRMGSASRWDRADDGGRVKWGKRTSEASR